MSLASAPGPPDATPFAALSTASDDMTGDRCDHESPGPASLLVLRGRVRVVAGAETVEVGAHQLNPVPDRRHSLHGDEDSVVLLSVAVPERAPLAD